MFLIQQGKNIDHKASDGFCLRIIYNFTYRLSGNKDVAEILTERVLLMQPVNHKHDDVILLKQAWEEFLTFYGRFDFKGEDVLQQALLSLPPEPRCAIILRDILSYSYGQIAIVLNKSDVTVGNLISQARQEISKKTRLSARCVI